MLEVDAARKRIALSIKQTMDAPQRKQGGKTDHREKPQPQKEVTMNDALSLLKKKFGK